MTSITNGFEIHGEDIRWGLPFKDVSNILSKYPQFPSYGGWCNARYMCSEIYGLKATEFQILAPFEDKPVMQVSYQLSPVEGTSRGNLHSFYVDQLTKTFGSPIRTDSNYEQPYLNRAFISGAVVYSAKWLTGDIRISLSVYGGVRHEESGDSAAGLYVDWINEKKAAEPFRQKNRVRERELLNYLDTSPSFEKYALAYEQRKFYIARIDIGDPDVTRDPDLRAAQMALYRSELLQTPGVLHNKLKDNEIGIKFIENSKLLIVANKWDTSILNYELEDRVSFVDVLPARGPGGYILHVKDLSIKDSRKSDVLSNLASYIESKTDIKISRSKEYDD